MVLGKRWLFSIGNGAEIWPLEMGRKSPETFVVTMHRTGFLGKMPFISLNICMLIT